MFPLTNAFCFCTPDLTPLPPNLFFLLCQPAHHRFTLLWLLLFAHTFFAGFSYSLFWQGGTNVWSSTKEAIGSSGCFFIHCPHPCIFFIFVIRVSVLEPIPSVIGWEHALDGFLWSNLLTSTFISSSSFLILSSLQYQCKQRAVIKSAYFLLNACRPDSTGGWLEADHMLELFLVSCNYPCCRPCWSHMLFVTLIKCSFWTHFLNPPSESEQCYIWKKGNKPKVVII